MSLTSGQGDTSDGIADQPRGPIGVVPVTTPRLPFGNAGMGTLTPSIPHGFDALRHPLTACRAMLAALVSRVLKGLKPLGHIGLRHAADRHDIGGNAQILHVRPVMPNLAHRLVGGAHGVIQT